MADIASTIQTPSQIAQNYLTILKAIKPSVDISTQDSDWWIRGQVVGGVVAGVYADLRLNANDAFPDRARQDAVLRFLALYFTGTQAGLLPATQAQGNVVVSGSPGATVSQNLQFLYDPNGNAYQATATVVLPSSPAQTVTGSIPVQSVNAGQAQNLLAGAQLTITSPPSGILPQATVDANGLADATDQESLTAARARIVERLQQPLGVGRVSDYIQYAEAADPSVTSASVIRFPFGLGTVGVVITSGTTNIDEAIDQGQTISVIPSDELVATVQAYLDINSPVTDCVTVFKPNQITQDVTVFVKYASGIGSTILSGQTLTQDQLVQREVMRSLYKTPAGGSQIGGSGFVLASNIEQTIDVMLSDESVETGSIPILLDRRVAPLTVTGFNRAMLANEVVTPGTITVIS